jgi:hypothetical protein
LQYKQIEATREQLHYIVKERTLVKTVQPRSLRNFRSETNYAVCGWSSSDRAAFAAKYMAMFAAPMGSSHQSTTVPPLTGAGVTIGFVDTGLDTTHPEFKIDNIVDGVESKTSRTSRVRAGTRIFRNSTLSDGDVGADASNDHGTHVVGIATGKFGGVAPSASIAFASIDASSTSTDMVNAVTWLINDQVHLCLCLMLVCCSTNATNK